MSSEHEQKLLAQNLLSAAARRDVTAVRSLLKSVSANVQDAETGFTPLHAVVTGGFRGSEASRDEEAALEIVQVLFENGAIWNDLDQSNETPGCIAFRLGLKKVYQAIVDAGVRAEIFLSKLEQLAPTDDDDEEQGDDEKEDLDENQTVADNPSNSVKEGTELAKKTSEPPEDYIDHWDSNAEFLKSSLRYTDTQLLDSSSNAVMMEWETEIMSRHANNLLPKTDLRVMNIGHGMGIIDAEIQKHNPAEHHIVEAHPAVLAHMRKTGWFDKVGVHVHQGRWQDVLPALVERGVVLDAIYYDTFAEDYKDLKELFSEHVIGLLDQEGRFGFYHGLGADRRVSYDVYTSVVELDLAEVGFKTEWEDIAVPTIDWKGVRRSYWNVGLYRLPTCSYE